ASRAPDARGPGRDGNHEPENAGGARRRTGRRAVPRRGRGCGAGGRRASSSQGAAMTEVTRSTRFVLTFALLLFAATMAFAHGNNDHVRGVVTQMSAQSITVELADKTTKTLTLGAKTTFEKSGKAAKMDELKVGDRVVVDVPKGTSEAHEIKFGAPAKK